MNSTELRDALRRLNLSQVGAARLLGVNERTMRRWCSGEAVVPQSVTIAISSMNPVPKHIKMTKRREDELYAAIASGINTVAVGRRQK